MSRAAMRALCLVAASLWCCFQAASRPALACSLAGNQPYYPDPKAQATDTTPPGAPTLAVETIQRGKGPAGCGTTASSCDDLGWITVQVSATDDQTPSDSLGYRVELVSGSVPAGLDLPTGAVRGGVEGSLLFGWVDGASDDQESLSFSLAIRAVDLAGNVGPASTIHIGDGGSSCALLARPAAPAPRTAALVSLVVVCGLARRRRRPRRGSSVTPC